MFTVGEFSRIAQVSKRLLRYYDEIGLLKPAHTDRLTGYRYYSAEQVSLLNRILVLKDLGLSLEQIQRLLKANVSTDEMQGMLLLKKAEIEQQIQGELQRVHKIESRLQAIRSAETKRPLNVVLKSAPAQPVLSLRQIVGSFETGLALFAQITTALPQKGIYGFRFCICHSGILSEHDMDLELGCLLEAKSHDPVTLHGNTQLSFRELPAAETIATFVVKGPLENLHAGYSEIGNWTEANGYHLAGIPREITLQTPQLIDGSDLITEIQFPVETMRHSKYHQHSE